MKNLEFKIDLPEEDPRRLDPLYDIQDLSQVKIYDPARGKIDEKEADRLAKRLPAKSVIFRLYAPREQPGKYDKMIITAFDSVIEGTYKRGKSLSKTSM